MRWNNTHATSVSRAVGSIFRKGAGSNTLGQQTHGPLRDAGRVGDPHNGPWIFRRTDGRDRQWLQDDCLEIQWRIRLIGAYRTSKRSATRAVGGLFVTQALSPSVPFALSSVGGKELASSVTEAEL